MTETIARIKKRIEKGFEDISNKFATLVSALGGKIDRLSPLPPEQTALLRRRAAYATAFITLSFLMGCAPSLFDCRPYAIALLFSAGHPNTVFVWLGGSAGAIVGGESPILYLILLGVSVIVRLAITSDRFGSMGYPIFGEPFRMRILMSSTAALVLELTRMLSDGFSPYLLLRVLSGALIAPLMTAAFIFAFDRSVHTALREGAIYLVIYVTVSALAGKTLSSFSFALILSFLLILHIASSSGLMHACLVGLVCGMGCGGLGVNLAVAGIAAGAFVPFGIGTSTFLSAALTLGIAFYFGGIPSLVAFTGDIIFASLLYIPLAKSGALEKINIFRKKAQDDVLIGDPATEKRASELRRDKMDKLSRAFGEMSEIFMRLGTKLRSPDAADLRGICEGAVDKVCAHCPISSSCLKEDFISGNDRARMLADRLSKTGALSWSELPENFRRSCRRADKLIREINDGYAAFLEGVLTRDKSELFALDYAALAEMLRSEQKEPADDGCLPDQELAKEASDLFRSLGISFSGVGAWGKRKKTVIVSGVVVSSLTVSAKLISEELSKRSKCKFGEPEFKFEGDFVSMTLSSLPSFRVGAAVSFQPRSGEESSGDSVSTFYTDDGRVFALICDGMGSGAEAAATAEVSAIFLKKMLSAGNGRGISLKLLSNFLCSRAAECHTTVDLVEIDLYTGKAVFLKCGAAPSYVFRSEKIFKVDSKSLPIGIMREVHSEETPLDTEFGDICMLVSDGVGATFESSLWLCDLVNVGRARSPAELADAVRARAVVENRGADDVSVAVIKIERA